MSGCASCCVSAGCRFSGPGPGRDLEGVARSGQGRQAGPDRGSDQPIPEPLFRVRPVRAVVVADSCRSARVTAVRGRPRPSRPDCRRPTPARTASATSTAATASAMTSCGAWCGAARAATTPWPRSSPSELLDPAPGLAAQLLLSRRRRGGRRGRDGGVRCGRWPRRAVGRRGCRRGCRRCCARTGCR